MTGNRALFRSLSGVEASDSWFVQRRQSGRIITK